MPRQMNQTRGQLLPVGIFNGELQLAFAKLLDDVAGGLLFGLALALRACRITLQRTSVKLWQKGSQPFFTARTCRSMV
ncbi:MAG: hypothetical protein R2748_22005 [Bryobacterales bacterium]